MIHPLFAMAERAALPAGYPGKGVPIMTAEKSDKEKGKDILKARDQAKKGLEPGAPEDAVEETEEREKEVAKDWLGVGLGVKRSG